MDNVLKDYVTHEQCADYRKDVYDRLNKTEVDIVDLKITNAEIRTTMSAMLTIGKAIFGVVATGMASIVIILLTRGL